MRNLAVSSLRAGSSDFLGEKLKELGGNGLGLGLGSAPPIQIIGSLSNEDGDADDDGKEQ